jgi:hypothetical protein
MKIIPVAPAIYKFKFNKLLSPLEMAAQKWSWHNVGELVEVLNGQHGQDSQGGVYKLNPACIPHDFTPLCGLSDYKPIVTVLLLKGDGNYELAQMDGEKYFTHHFRTDREIYIPSGWGMRILEIVKRMPVYKTCLICGEGKMPKLLAMDWTDQIICELPMGDIPILNPNKYIEP